MNIDFLLEAQKNKIKDLLGSALTLHTSDKFSIIANHGQGMFEMFVNTPKGDLLVRFALRDNGLGLLTSENLYLAPQLRGKGLATVLQHIKVHIAKQGGYKGLICTVRKDNAVEQRCLDKFGWQRVATYCIDGDVDLAVLLFR